MTASIAYFPPVSWFSLLKNEGFEIEAFENFQKQSWRNRCNILTANGVESLLVPVVHSGGTYRHPIREIRIDYSRDWVVRHKRAIDSAYMSSAYYIYYRDELFSILDSHPECLWDLDMEIIRFICGVFNLPLPSLTTSFKGVDVDIHPKHPDRYSIGARPYYQVFGDRFPFVPNLSVMDLLFNEGPSLLIF